MLLVSQARRASIGYRALFERASDLASSVLLSLPDLRFSSFSKSPIGPGLRPPYCLTLKGLVKMAKAELGVKRRCLNCSAPFFDLNRTPIACPKCEAVFQVVEIAHSPVRRTPMRPFVMERPAPAEPVEAEVEESPLLLVDEEESEDAAVVTT